MKRIVVGVDGSDGSMAALAWALEEGRAHGAAVEAVHAWSVPHVAGPMSMYVPEMPYQEFEAAATRILDQAVEKLADQAEGVEVTKVVTEGGAGRALCDAAAGADLLVVGSRGYGGVRGLLLGSVSQYCSHHAPCALTVVPIEKG